MALEVVQAGYKSSLYLYTAGTRMESEASYAEWLAELTTELELALEGGTEDKLSDFDTGEDDMEDDGKSEVYSNRKKEWEELLEHAKVVEAMLKQMLENGLGQQKEEDKMPQKKKEEEQDNDFSLEGIPMRIDGKSKNSDMPADSAGNSQFLQNNSGLGAEYLGLSGGGRKTVLKHPLRTICLTCETKCERKKQWKIVK